MAKKSKSSSKLLKSWSKLTNKNKLGVIAILAAATVGVVMLGYSRAVTSQFVLSLSQTNATQGSEVVASLFITPESSVDGVEAILTYDSNKLQYAGIDYEGSAFPIKLGENYQDGTITITRGILGDKVTNPNSLIAKVTFKALSKRGSTDITLSGNATNSGSYTNPLEATESLKFGNAKGGGKNNDNGGGGSGKEKNPKSPKWQ